MKQYLRVRNSFETAQILTYEFKNTKSMFPLAIITFTNRNNPTLFFTISLEIRNRATWYQAHLPINGYYAISDLFNAVQRLQGRVQL
ncbi:hypothetical protein T12_7295 [Trichinella patagoniensis]|uniref:Uncharacterized protein n=1 Tax=Trichinella patagoniensis TaxID=990121 RepID=A0A0V0ZWM7_9BILA|nr:hypothetical protein T12_7295 [Trichinella patagoniensis]